MPPWSRSSTAARIPGSSSARVFAEIRPSPNPGAPTLALLLALLTGHQVGQRPEGLGRVVALLRDDDATAHPEPGRVARAVAAVDVCLVPRDAADHDAGV